MQLLINSNPLLASTCQLCTLLLSGQCPRGVIAATTLFPNFPVCSSLIPPCQRTTSPESMWVLNSQLFCACTQGTVHYWRKKKKTAGLIYYQSMQISSQSSVLTLQENSSTLCSLILLLHSTKTASPWFSMSSILTNLGETSHSSLSHLQNGQLLSPPENILFL